MAEIIILEDIEKKDKNGIDFVDEFSNNVNFNLGTLARHVLLTNMFLSEHNSIKFVIKSVAEFSIDKPVTYKQICDLLEEGGCSLAPFELAPYFRLSFSGQKQNSAVIYGSEPFYIPSFGMALFNMWADFIGSKNMNCICVDNKEFDPNFNFVFVEKSS